MSLPAREVDERRGERLPATTINRRVKTTRSDFGPGVKSDCGSARGRKSSGATIE
jgi:hypothetical protein